VVQRFLRPGEGTLGPERVLPAATSYLVHLALSGVIGRMIRPTSEPHVDPGQIWATEEFRERLFEKPSLWRMTPVAGPGSGCIARGSGRPVPRASREMAGRVTSR